MPISGDHIPGVGMLGGAIGARIGCGAVRGAAVSEGRWLGTGRAGWGGGCESGAAE